MSSKLVFNIVVELTVIDEVLRRLSSLGQLSHTSGSPKVELPWSPWLSFVSPTRNLKHRIGFKGVGEACWLEFDDAPEGCEVSLNAGDRFAELTGLVYSRRVYERFLATTVPATLAALLDDIPGQKATTTSPYGFSVQGEFIDIPRDVPYLEDSDAVIDIDAYALKLLATPAEQREQR